MADIDYETEYDNRARVPEHPEIFARWTRDAELFRAEALKNGRAELGLCYGDTPRQTVDLFFPAVGRAGAARHVHPWWLVAFARSIVVQPCRSRPERARGGGGGGRLRSLPECLHRRHHRADAPRLRIFMAAVWPAHAGLRPFGRRSPRRRDAGDRLAVALPQGARRSRPGRIFRVRPIRPYAADRRQLQSGFAARCRDCARGVAGVLADKIRSHLRCGRRRPGVERVQAAEQTDRAGLAAGRGADPLSGDQPAPTISRSSNCSRMHRAR